MTRLQRIIEMSGFGNGRNELSFNKLVTFTALWFFGVALYGIIVTLRQVPPWYVWSFGFGVVGAGFGLKGYLGAAARRTENLSMSGSTITNVDAAKVIDALPNLWRDDESGGAP